ncbi:SagB family peptide dehydrogenase [Nocardia sp. NPDC058497]|uniref:SagB family peptide dehydrogenase n=1 Tax=Nocardia sp. NPDC058497 TaxID=3346529 RepID=UPI003662EB96
MRPSVSIGTEDTGTRFHLLLRGLWVHSESFPWAGSDHVRLLQRLATTGIDLRANSEPPDSTEVLRALSAGGWLTLTVYSNSRRLYSVYPTGPMPAGFSSQEDEPSAHPTGRMLSRFAVSRRQDESLIVESPLAAARLEISDPALAAVLGAVALGETGEPAAGTLPTTVVNRFLRDLGYAGVLADPSADEPAHLRQWATQDLWFHHRSRVGNGAYPDAGFGRTEWGKQLHPSVPILREPHAGARIALPKPDLATKMADDVPLAWAMETRRSVREHDNDNPLDLRTLSELLYRSARIRSTSIVQGTEYVSSPYPSGGSAYELEVYPVVGLVDGLSSGVYHYDKFGHSLCRIDQDGDSAQRLLRTAGAAVATRERPQVLLIISARFGRLLRTYESIPYALILKDVGVLYQSVYLVATSLGIGACALGAGDEALFSEVIRTERTVESSVGELILGSVRPRSN